MTSSIACVSHLYEVKRELWRITEMREGAVFKTEYVRDVWVDWDGESPIIPPEGYKYVSLSDDGVHIRRKR